METAPSPVKTVPFAALGLIMFTATLIGGWLYVENVRDELVARIDGTAAMAAKSGRAVRPEPESTPAQRAYFDRGLGFAIPGTWSTDRGSGGDAYFFAPDGRLMADIACGVEEPMQASDFTKLAAERKASPDQETVSLFEHRSGGDSDVPPWSMIQVRHPNRAGFCRFRSEAATASEMREAYDSLTVASLY